MSSMEICGLIEQTILREDPDAHVDKVPVADGGEGFVDAYLTMCGGRKYEKLVSGPLFEPVRAYWGMLTDDCTAVIEMSAAAGLELLTPEQRNPGNTTTLGVGELIIDAVEKGARKIILGLGGSATNDGGIGMAYALGYRFLDEAGQELPPVGFSLARIHHIEAPAGKRITDTVIIEAACDVDNPLYGSNGAAHIYGPQKGADADMAARLDAGLVNLAVRLSEDMGIDISRIPGGGAAGGLGAGAVAFLDAKLHSGIDLLLDAVNFDEMVRHADYCFTGEGRIDGQSLSGKTPVGVARRAQKYHVPVIGIAGSLGRDIDSLYDAGFTTVISTIRSLNTLEETLKSCREDLCAAVRSVIRLIVTMEQHKS